MDKVFDATDMERYEAWLESPAGGRWQEASCQLLDRVLDWRAGWRVLDVGCGLGVHLGRLAQRGMHVFGLEAGPVAAKLAARRLGPKADIEVGDAADLPYEDNSFDAVIMVNTLELTERPAQVLAEASRVASSRLCVVTANSTGLAGQRRWLPLPPHPLFKGRPQSLFGMWRMVREVLGPVPQRWAGAMLWPQPRVARWPLASLVGLAAAVTPRLRTKPLVLDTAPQGSRARPATVASRSTLQRVK